MKPRSHRQLSKNAAQWAMLRVGILFIVVIAAGACVPPEEAPQIASAFPAPLPTPTTQPEIIVLTPTQPASLLLMTPGASFCDYEQVQSVLRSLMDAIKEQDGVALRELIDPVSGVDIYFTAASFPVNFAADAAEDLFASTSVYIWGTHPGSGLPVEGTFALEILPSMLDVMDRAHTQACQSLEPGVGTGPTTATVEWPDEHSGIPFIALYRSPGPAENELDWRTWAVGFSVVDGEPKVRVLIQYFWEP